MSLFAGTGGADVITPTLVSPGAASAGLPGAGADTLLGADGADTLNGGSGGDSLSGGAGDDRLIYDATAIRDKLTVLDGGAGTDALQVNASGEGGGWSVALQPGATGHATVTGSRSGQSFGLDTSGVETIQVAGGAAGEHLSVGDLSATSVRQVVLDLGAGVPDGATDDVTLVATGAADRVVAQWTGAELAFRWGAQTARLQDLGFGDRISLWTGAGDDSLDVSDALGVVTTLTVDGGAGADAATFRGTDGIDAVSISAVAGHVLAQARGTRVDMTGVETLSVQAGGGADDIRIGDLSGTGVGRVNLDLAGPGGGPDGAVDTVTYSGPAEVFSGGPGNPLISLRAVTSGELDVELVTQNGRTALATITGLEPIDVLRFQGSAGNDRYELDFSRPNAVLDLGAGADVVTVPYTHAAIATILLGDGNDAFGGALAASTILGGAGADFISSFTGGVSNVLRGEAGNDYLFAGGLGDVASGGDDNDTLIALGLFPVTLNGDAGDDWFRFYYVETPPYGLTTANGGSGLDTFEARPDIDLLADEAEPSGWVVSLRGGASGAHLSTTRTGAGDAVELRGIETVSLTGGSAENFFGVGDLSGTDVREVDIGLGFNGANNHRFDQVLLQGTTAADRLSLSDNGVDTLTVEGLSARVIITSIDAGLEGPHWSDRIALLTGDGDDVIDLTHRTATIYGELEVDAGPGSNTILAGHGRAIFELAAGEGGRTTVIGFQGATAGGYQWVDVSSLGDASLSDLHDHHHIFQSGADTVVADGTGTFITLQNVSLSSLTSLDFLFF